MDHIGSGPLLADFTVDAEPNVVFCGSLVNSAAGIKPEIGQELSKPFAFSHGCPPFSFSPAGREA
jgi:hypothetical protein